MRDVPKSLLILWIASFVLWSATAGLAAAENRVALVIGNSAYRNVPLLPNPANDAADVAASLTRLGFAVEVVKDGGFDDLRRALIAFGAKAREADMAMIFFAGHGMEVAGENWIVPVDAALRTDADVENETIGLKSLVLAVSGARTLGLVMLDACRNNPFDSRMQHASRTRAVSRGLAPIEPVDNVLVAYAAKDGTTATDGDGRNSPFTGALLSHLETPGLEIDFLLRNVRDDVLAATAGRQQPFFYGSLSKEAVYLQPATNTAAADPPRDTPTADEIAWPYVAASADAGLARRFVAEFPTSRHRTEAEARAATLEAAASAPAPLAAQPALQGAADVAATPDQTAVARRFDGNGPQVEAAWSLVKTSADPATLRHFTDEFPSRQRKTVVAALNGTAGTSGVLRQLRTDEMHAVLSDYGRFVQNPRYGEVWVPSVTPLGWHPYEPCHWVRSTRFDWYYLDRTPWGAIVHHYGRWAHDDALGWIWVPGVDFSPGWVVWRVAPEQIGWAPMPPVEDIRTTTVAQFDRADFWTFVDKDTFIRGCAGRVVRPVAPVTTLLQTAVFVRELRIVNGIPVFVLPLAIAGAPVDVDVTFDPWPAWLASQILVDWNWVWGQQAALCPPVAPLKVTVPPPKPPPPKPAQKPAAKPKAPQAAKAPPPHQPAPPAPKPPPRRRVPAYDPDDGDVVVDAPPPPRVYPPRPYLPGPFIRPYFPQGGGFGLGGYGRPSGGNMSFPGRGGY